MALRSLFPLISALFLGTPPAQAESPAYLGLHGMALFGGAEHVFASHLPMFHAPHDIQAVVELRLADARRDRELRAELAASSGLWTLVPEPFVLTRLAPGATEPLASLRADLYEGHFERGGRLRRRGVLVRILAVPMYRPLKPGDRGTLHYLRLGKGRDSFLVAEIGGRPGFDQILHAPGLAPERTGLELGPARASCPELAELRKALGDQALGEIYCETGDLR
ncbi:MAG: hypothetical protein HYV16_11170 [Gammaproteobacteria bacterium]|nr:hypothetical protein [Gammaproteobacteria bacterium]